MKSTKILHNRKRGKKCMTQTSVRSSEFGKQGTFLCPKTAANTIVHPALGYMHIIPVGNAGSLPNQFHTALITVTLMEGSI